MPVGIVKWFDQRMGYGFITSTEGDEIFVHHSNIQSEGFRTLRPNDQVEYEPAQGSRGAYALAVKCVVEARTLKKMKHEKANAEHPALQSSE